MPIPFRTVEAILQKLTAEEACPEVMVINARGQITLLDGSDAAPHLLKWMQDAGIAPGTPVNVADRDMLKQMYLYAQRGVRPWTTP